MWCFSITLLSCIPFFISWCFLRHRFLSPPPDLYRLLKTSIISDELLPYLASPHISESVWDAVGNEVLLQEKRWRPCASEEQVITLRITINKKRDYCHTGNAAALVKQLGAKYGYASDREMVFLLLAPSDQAHLCGGNRDKLQAKALLAASRLLGWVDVKCRVGIWDTEEDAFRLFLYRNYMTMKQAIYRRAGGLRGMDALRWCQEHQAFPTGHQAYGTFLVKQSASREVDAMCVNLLRAYQA